MMAGSCDLLESYDFNKISVPTKPHNKDLRYTRCIMAEFICPDCGKRLYHENATTLEVEKGIHKKFCTKTQGSVKSFVHREPNEKGSIVGQKAYDDNGTPILKR